MEYKTQIGGLIIENIKQNGIYNTTKIEDIYNIYWLFYTFAH